MGVQEVRRVCGLMAIIPTILVLIFILAYPWYYQRFSIQVDTPSIIPTNQTVSDESFSFPQCTIYVWLGWFQSYCDTSQSCSSSVWNNYQNVFNPRTVCSTFFPHQWRDNGLFYLKTHDNIGKLNSGCFGLVFVAMILLVISTASFLINPGILADKRFIHYGFIGLPLISLIFLLTAVIYYPTAFVDYTQNDGCIRYNTQFLIWDTLAPQPAGK